jgi:hypothetical protein
LTNVVTNHPKCLGNSPTVTVEIKKITLTELIARFRCQGGKVIPFLETMSLTSVAVVDRMCDKCVTIDFSKSSTGEALTNGMEVGSKWLSYGLTIKVSSKPSRFSFPAPRIFDTGNITCITRTGDFLYGSPNQECPGGGVGLGFGGSVGKIGENCRPIGSKLSGRSYSCLQSCSSIF